MTKEEIYLIKELIKEAVKSVVKETLREELNSNKDLREVKFLLAKTLKEGASRPASTTIDESTRQRIRESVGADFQPPARKPVMSMSPEQAMNVSQNGTLPDFDAPIPAINKSSVIWKDLKEKVS